MQQRYFILVVTLLAINSGITGGWTPAQADTNLNDDEPKRPPIWTQCPGAGCPAGHGSTPEDMLRVYNDGRYNLDEFDVRKLQAQ